MRPVPYPVQASKLDTQFLADPRCTHHVKFVSDDALNQRRIRKEEKWGWERRLGRGSYGVVWLERCIQGDAKDSLRAVKEVQKPKSGEYYGELEAIALFSHAKYEHCFVKSLGWFDNEFNIFIAMEYLPNGDLQNYLHSPLSEKEARHIAVQVLEGLQFMHDNGFTHRDLKPANILVKCKGPDWWVKIGDFGISKHVIEEQTALRTSVGTPSFAAPEVHGFFRPGGRPKDFYTNAVDVWSLGVIAFRILSAENPFKDPPRLNQYVIGDIEFPSNVLLLNNVSVQGCEFVNSLMAPVSEDRPTVKDCLQHPWFKKTGETRVEINISNLSLSQDYFEPEPSAKWSTQDQISTQEPNKLSKVLWGEEPTLPRELASSPNPTSGNTIVPSTPENTDPELSSDQSVENHRSADERRKISMVEDSVSPPRRISRVDERSNLPRRISRVEEMERGPPRNIITPSTSTKYELTPAASLLKWIRSTPAAPKVVKSSTSTKTNPSTSTIDKVLKPPTLTTIPPSTSPYDEKVRFPTFAPPRIVSQPRFEPASDVDWRLLTILQDHSKSVRTVAFSPDGKLIASGSRDGTIKLSDSAKGRLRAEFEGHASSILALKFSSDGKLLVSASTDRGVKRWDLTDSNLMKSYHTHESVLLGTVFYATFSPDGTQLATISYNTVVHVWNSVTMMLSSSFHANPATIFTVAFSPDGKLIASGLSTGFVKFWDSITRKIYCSFQGHSSGVTKVAFSPDGTTLASGSIDTTVKLWDLATMGIKHTLYGHTDAILSIAFSPDGTQLASGSKDRTLKIWDVFGGMLLRLLYQDIGTNDVAFSPSGAIIAAGGENRKVRIWDFSTKSHEALLAAEETTAPDARKKQTGFEEENPRFETSWDI